MVDDFTPIPLTAAQIALFDEVGKDQRANDETLKVALTLHTNRVVELRDRANAQWEDLAATHGLDFETARYKTANVGGRVCIVKASNDD